MASSGSDNIVRKKTFEHGNNRNKKNRYQKIEAR
jgi:hypothetical protein